MKIKALQVTKSKVREGLGFQFCLLYVFIIIGCIVFEIEKWPLSNFGVFAYRSHPKDKRVYRIAIETGPSEYHFVFPEKGMNKIFSELMVGRKSGGFTPLELAPQVIADSVSFLKSMGMYSKFRGKSIVVIKRSVIVDESDHFTFKNTPIYRKILD